MKIGFSHFSISISETPAKVLAQAQLTPARTVEYVHLVFSALETINRKDLLCQRSNLCYSFKITSESQA